MRTQVYLNIHVASGTALSLIPMPGRTGGASLAEADHTSPWTIYLHVPDLRAALARYDAARAAEQPEPEEAPE